MNNIEAAEIKEAVQEDILEFLADGMFRCVCCNCPISGEMQAIGHIRGSKHVKKMRQSLHAQGQVSPPFELLTKKICPGINTNNHLEIEEGKVTSVQSSEYFCDTCNVSLNGKSQYDDHLVGKIHAKKVNKLITASLLDRNSDVSSSRSSSCSPTPIVKLDVSLKSNSSVTPTDSLKSHSVSTLSSDEDEDSSVIPITAQDNNNNNNIEDLFKGNLIIVEVDEPIPEFFK